MWEEARCSLGVRAPEFPGLQGFLGTRRRTAEGRPGARAELSFRAFRVRLVFVLQKRFSVAFLVDENLQIQRKPCSVKERATPLAGR